MSDDKNIILEDEKEHVIPGHNYDGIQELSKSMPWWLSLIFFCTVSYSLIYLIHMGSGSGVDQKTELKLRMLEIEKKREAAEVFILPTDPVDATAALANGLSIFKSNCAACHGEKGEGTIGPNLTDEFWLHGNGQPAAIEEVIEKGVSDKGMPPWGNVLKPNEVANVVAFVRSLAGTKLPGKAPQGTKVP
jgi:cytochrome c oxidase cbb3-type subunit 3